LLFDNEPYRTIVVARKPDKLTRRIFSRMDLPIKLISTDFDGTLYSDFENPPVPVALQETIARLQAQGAKWVINTGRDLSSLMETLGRAHLSVKPDYLVLVEREIYCHQNSQYVELEQWNSACTRAHAELFVRVRQDLPGLVQWVNERFSATIYEDAFSPFCLIAERNEDADAIYDYLNVYCRQVPNLAVVRNDIYARFSHVAFNKGTALNEIARKLGISRDHVLVAGDHLNDIPMLSCQFARYIVAPANAIPCVKKLVQDQNGHVSEFRNGHGVVDGIKACLNGQAALVVGSSPVG
jgi:HAD superfamily hydrolase (TIGR01484 family)